MGKMGDYLPEQSDIVRRIYEWHEQQDRNDPHGGRLGASVIGDKCDRALWYRFRLPGGKEFEGRLLRLFETGHLEEPRFVRELRGIGCHVEDVDANTGKQFEFTTLGGHLVCHPDAALIGLLEAPRAWHIGEFKTMGGTETEKSKDFEKVKKDGVKKAKPMHYAQVQVAMGLSKGINRALYLAKKKTTDEIYAERIPYDAKFFKKLMARVESIIKASSPPERYSTRADTYQCKFCDAKKICWGTSDNVLAFAKKTCRSCCHATPEIDKDTNSARWSCAKRNIPSLSLEDQETTCQYHLILPGLILFADATDSGDDWIEFTNHNDNTVWVHGFGAGMWSTEELMTTPVAGLKSRSIHEVRKNVGGKVIDIVDIPKEEGTE